ncbi:MAG TPA: hypothetical protein VEL76_07630, partial [Gemmataceae bacterium]|nr:hypothetical protein [Gemmataceae bacterium]
AFDQAVGELQRHALRAVRTLARNLKAAKASDQNRAADLILSHARDYAELDDLAKRIEAIEALLRQPEQAKEPPAIATEDDQL